MQPSTGKILKIKSDAHREQLERKLGEKLVPIPDNQLETLRGQSAAERIAWCKQEIKRLRLGTHEAAPVPGETPEDTRAVKNARKRQRRARRWLSLNSSARWE